MKLLSSKRSELPVGLILNYNTPEKFVTHVAQRSSSVVTCLICTHTHTHTNAIIRHPPRFLKRIPRLSGDEQYAFAFVISDVKIRSNFYTLCAANNFRFKGRRSCSMAPITLKDHQKAYKVSSMSGQ